MNRFLHRLRCVVPCLATLILSPHAYGAITVIDYYRLGEADAGAANGATVNATTADSVGTKPLSRIGSPTYTNAVSADAALHTASQLGVSFNGSGQGLSNSVLSTVTDNFGIEAWVRPNTASGNHSIAYNGNTSTSGWGIYQFAGTYGGLLGGASIFGSAPITLNGWTHVALVRASGTNTVYVNGAAAGSVTNNPILPAGGFCIGLPGQGGATENFSGQIDEVRVFTFAAGQFSANDLLLNASGNPSLFTMNDTLQTDVNGNGRPNPGDTIRYTVIITNKTGGTLSNVVFNSSAVPNAPLVGGSLRAAPLARSDSPPANSVPGNAFHGSFNTTLNVSVGSGLLANDFTGAPAATITSFGGGSFGGSVTAHAAGTTANTPGIGALTVNADGSLTFVPASGFTGPTTFQYRLANSVGTNDASATLAIGNRPAANTDAYNVTGNTLLDTSLIPQTVLANDTGDGTGISTSTATGHGSVNLSANGNFLYTPAAGYTGADSFTYTLTNGFGGVVGTVNLTVANKLWYIDNSVAANGDGRSSSPFKQTSDFTTANDGAAGHPADNDMIFLRQGSGNYTGGATLRAGQKLIGDGASGTFSSLFGFALASGSAKAAGVAVPALTGTRPFILVPSATGVSLNSGNTVLGLNVHSANGRAFSGAPVGSLVISNVTASAAGDRTLSLSNGTVNVTLDSVSSTNSVDSGIVLTNINGSLVANGGYITGAAGTDFVVSGGNGTITYAGGINNTAGRSADISGRTGGTVMLSGNITDTGTGIIVQNNTGGTTTFSGGTKTLNTGANTAVTLTSNTGHTINFSNGGLAVTTTSGAGLNVTGGGTVTVTTGANANTISSTTGTALNVANTTIGASGLTFQSITAGTGAGGPANGIILNNTGGSGGLAVVGTGSAGTGGTIQKTTASGISLTSVGGSVSLTEMNISNTGGDGITAATVNNFSCSLCNIINPGSSASKHGLRLTELSGTASLSNVTVTGATQNGCFIQNTSATLTSLTVSGGSFGTNNNAFGTAGIGMGVYAATTGVITSATISGTTFGSNFGSGLQSSAQDTATIGDITVTNCTFTKNGNTAADFDAGTGSNP